MSRFAPNSIQHHIKRLLSLGGNIVRASKDLVRSWLYLSRPGLTYRGRGGDLGPSVAGQL